MNEYSIFRHNPGIDPALHLWGWEIPVYLFFGGLVAGLMVISGVRLIVTRPKERQALVCCTFGPLLGMLLLSTGMLMLFLDLENKAHVWRLYLTFEITSPMSWGSWILLLVYPAMTANALAHLPEAFPALARRFPVLVSISDFLLASPRMIIGIGFANMAIGVGLGVYTGLLLNTMAARPLWNSSLLGLLFLFSGLSAAAAVLHAILILSMKDEDRPAFADFILSNLARWSQAKAPDTRVAPTLAKADNSFLTVELFLLALFIIGLLTSTQAHQEAAQLLLTGAYAAPFWVFVIGMGILVPLVLQFLGLRNRIRPTLVPEVLVLTGGLALRIILVFAGQASHWAIAAQ